jgi:exopolysaccharide biosynthesis WecB/TagA/CpsF family protein
MAVAAPTLDELRISPPDAEAARPSLGGWEALGAARTGVRLGSATTEAAPFELSRQHVALGDVLIDRLDLRAAVGRIRGFFRGGSHQIVTVNLDFLSIAARDSRFREVINEAAMAVADGMPLVWVSRLRGQPLPQRITGVELADECCRLAAELGRGVFLLGAAPGVAATAARRLELRHPGLRIAGVYSPPFGPLSAEEDAHIVELIKQAAPGLLLVALGAPQQDVWIHAHRGQLDVPVAMGVGCVFDLLAGVVERAPVWMQQAGLEWSYRLLQEPGRLWRRYLIDDLPMLGRLLLEPDRRASGAPTAPPAGYTIGQTTEAVDATAGGARRIGAAA